MRDLSIKGEITIFKTLAISKIAHLGFITNVPAFIFEQHNVIKNFIWHGKKKNKTLYFKTFLQIRWH